MLHVYIVIVQVVCIGASLPAKLTVLFTCMQGRSQTFCDGWAT